MHKLMLCYPSRDKENIGIEMLYGPLSLAYLASHTPKNYDISLIDEFVGEDLDPKTVDADIVAFSSLTSGITRAYFLADKLRTRGITVVIGGAHVTAMTNEALQHVDAVIMGEGETPWNEFLEDYEKGEIRKTYFGKMNVSLDKLGTPDRRFIHPNYHYPSLMTSRGCPFHCSFCYLTVYKNRKYRTFPQDIILEDMETLRGSELVIVTDENFIGYTDRDIADRRALLIKMIDRRFDFYWGCQSTINIAEQPELMELMYKAGCRAIFIGFEAMGDDSLKFINKNHNIGVDYKDAIKKIHHHKLAVIASTILGLDHQEFGYHKKLIKDLKNIKADFVRVFFMTAWPGTPLFRELVNQGRASTKWDNLRKDIPSVKFKNYSHEEAINARKEIMDSFFNFFNLSKVILRWLFKDRSLMKLFIKMGFRNLKSEKIRNLRATNQIKSEKIQN
jgi:radical SAM superfamily enzyme YgiQ (UPF0313 family)